MSTAAIPFAIQPAAQGSAWLRRAFAMFRQYRLQWVLLFCGYLAVLFAVNLIPAVGPLVVFALKPVLAVGLLAAAWSQERGGAPAMSQLFHGFRSNVLALLSIGAFFVLGMALVIQASAIVDGGKLRDFVAGLTPVTEEQAREAFANTQMQLAMLFSAVLALPVLLATWWAPALVVFHDVGAAKALATSLRASLANWRALATYTVIVFFFYAMLPMMVLTLLALLLPAALMQVLVFLVALPYSIVLTVTLHISDYVSYRDVFHPDEALAPLASGNPAA